MVLGVGCWVLGVVCEWLHGVGCNALGVHVVGCDGCEWVPWAYRYSVQWLAVGAMGVWVWV